MNRSIAAPHNARSPNISISGNGLAVFGSVSATVAGETCATSVVSAGGAVTT
jgi:hypothetical protein